MVSIKQKGLKCIYDNNNNTCVEHAKMTNEGIKPHGSQTKLYRRLNRWTTSCRTCDFSSTKIRSAQNQRWIFWSEGCVCIGNIVMWRFLNTPAAWDIKISNTQTQDSLEGHVAASANWFNLGKKKKRVWNCTLEMWRATDSLSSGMLFDVFF